MTNEERDKTIEFLLEHMASLTVRMDILTAQTEANAAAIRDLSASIKEVNEQAEADRTEIRQGIDKMLSFAEAMRDMTKNLVLAQQGTSQRVGRTEDRLDDHAARIERLEQDRG